MSRTEDVKQEVRAFYDSVGWQQIGEGLYQNARYEDLRPVSQEYLHRCHLRVLDHLAPEGRFLLDAGSGPIQYPEYLSYSQGYQRRVCVDISHTALVAARDRIGDHGLYVVADVAHLPLKAASMDGLVSLHTVHHLPAEEHLPAFEGFPPSQAGRSGRDSLQLGLTEFVDEGGPALYQNHEHAGWHLPASDPQPCVTHGGH